MKTPDYMSYTKYKKKKNNNSQKAIIIFVTTFFATLLFLIVMASNLSPNVDVTIGEDSDMEAKESGLGVKRFIDDRLKMIQMEDKGDASATSQKILNKKTAGYDDSSFDNFSKELDERVIIPQPRQNESSEETPVVSHTPPRPHAVKDLSTPFEGSKVTKVFVGYYNTVEQAKVAQGILIDTGLNITPFIKNIGGSYSLQVGSFSTRSKAESLASELLKNNFPARVTQE